jgi:hypothetical protein
LGRRLDFPADSSVGDNRRKFQEPCPGGRPNCGAKLSTGTSLQPSRKSLPRPSVSATTLTIPKTAAQTPSARVRSGKSPLTTRSTTLHRERMMATPTNVPQSNAPILFRRSQHRRPLSKESLASTSPRLTKSRSWVFLLKSSRTRLPRLLHGRNLLPRLCSAPLRRALL